MIILDVNIYIYIGVPGRLDLSNRDSLKIENHLAMWKFVSKDQTGTWESNDHSFKEGIPEQDETHFLYK